MSGGSEVTLWMKGVKTGWTCSTRELNATIIGARDGLLNLMEKREVNKEAVWTFLASLKENDEEGPVRNSKAILLSFSFWVLHGSAIP